MQCLFAVPFFSLSFYGCSKNIRYLLTLKTHRKLKSLLVKKRVIFFNKVFFSPSESWQFPKADQCHLVAKSVKSVSFLIKFSEPGKLLQYCPPLVSPWTVAHQASLSLGFSREEHWSRLPCPPPGDLADPGIEPAFLVLRWHAGSLPLVTLGKLQAQYRVKNTYHTFICKYKF